ncbi:MAG TPA: 3-keto-5-aminohexanoate cleavage protein [Bryobacteraceae bacterium]|nr:3-keto-5-aminohexanoate cleavage protein [Bryobacteraceae bacterium]
MSSADALIINAAITGCVVTKNDTPHLPVTHHEIVNCARRVQDAGASIIHLHARNADQSPCYEAAVYRDLVGAVREACGNMIVCVSLSGRYVPSVDARAAALESGPDMASLTLGSMNFAKQASVNSPDVIRELATRIYAANAVPEMEVFEAGFINFANYLISKGTLRPPYYFNLILGALGAAPLDLVGLGHMVSMLPQNSIWAVGGLGQYQLDANVMSIAAGGHVRVGVEDNLYFDRRKTQLADNLQMVERLARIAREMGRPPATASEARQLIGLPQARLDLLPSQTVVSGAQHGN